ncbi:MAG: hypothetical protein IKK08_10450 [Clostridia bacterium]|nr:hypothetical protein [Clostridia bacterium]
MDNKTQTKKCKICLVNFLSNIKMFLQKRGWYLFLLSLSSFYVWNNRTCFHNISQLSPKNIIFFIWIALLLLPLFSEMEFLGVKFKRAIEKANAEVMESIKELKIQMLDLKVSTNVANNFHIGTLPTTTEMETLEKILPTNSQSQDNQFPEDTPAYLLKVRMKLEQLLGEIYNIVYPNAPIRIHLTRAVYELLKAEMISGVECDMIVQTIRIANSAIHGVPIEDEHVNFVLNAYPSILTSLERAKDHALETYQ